ncbi:MAG: hypothetical protein KBC98_01630 [Candidatus Pacebacteria bacterium]|nr:hypothetical protein [Candidatus Paceibacterota bacterium]
MNKILRRKAMRRIQVLRLFKKSYLIYVAMFILGFVGFLIIHLEIFAILVLCPFFLAILTFIAQEIFIENIQMNKPLTKQQRREVVFILDVVKETSYFEVQYLKPGTRVKDLC